MQPSGRQLIDLPATGKTFGEQFIDSPVTGKTFGEQFIDSPVTGKTFGGQFIDLPVTGKTFGRQFIDLLAGAESLLIGHGGFRDGFMHPYSSSLCPIKNAAALLV